MFQPTPKLLADALARGTLHSLVDPVAEALLDPGETIDAQLEALSGTAAFALAIEDLVDLACLQGDQEMRRQPKTKGWYTIALSALLRSDSDHRLHTLGDARELTHALTDALGLDYGSLRLGTYVLHSLSAMAMGPSDFAKTCATARLEVAHAMPPGVEPYYGMNELGTKPVQLAQQVTLFVNVQAQSADESREMAAELNGWVTAETRLKPLGFELVTGQQLIVECIPLMAGLPWSLRRTAAYEIQSLVLAEVAQAWMDATVGGEPHFATLCDFTEEGEVSGVNLYVWFGEKPEQLHAARLNTVVAGQLLDEKLCNRLFAKGWHLSEVELDQPSTSVKLTVEGRTLPVQWDARFAP